MTEYLRISARPMNVNEATILTPLIREFLMDWVGVDIDKVDIIVYNGDAEWIPMKNGEQIIVSRGVNSFIITELSKVSAFQGFSYYGKDPLDLYILNQSKPNSMVVKFGKYLLCSDNFDNKGIKANLISTEHSFLYKCDDDDIELIEKLGYKLIWRDNSYGSVFKYLNGKSQYLNLELLLQKNYRIGQ